MKSEIIRKMEEVLANADTSAVASQAKLLQREYEQAFSSEMEKARQEFIDEGGRARDFIYSKTKEDEKIVELFDKFRKLKKQNEEKILQEQKKSLEIKKQIVADINDLSKLEVNVGSAVKKLQELQAKWKETGNVPPAFYRDMQSEYSKAIESFYYNLTIYRALQDHDLKKNFELKESVVSKLKELTVVTEIKDLEKKLRFLRNEWDEIGPVPQEKWEELKASYKTVLDEIYSLMKSKQEALQQIKLENLKKKEELVEKIKSILIQELVSDSDWKKATDEVLNVQNEYKNSGHVDRAASEDVYRRFREQCDLFFEKKKDFFAVWKEKLEELKKQKNDLITQAEQLMTQTDWKEVSEKLIRLQDRWKKIGSLGQEEHRFFMRFRKACNQFFDAKKAHFEEKDAQFSSNLVVKEEILKELNAFELIEDLMQNRESLKAFNQKWNEAGMVPFKDKQRLNDLFYNRLDELFDRLNIEAKEKNQMKYLAKIDRLKQSDNSETLLKREKDFIKKNIDEINSSVRTFENNMGFFKVSKGKGDLMSEFETKIQAERSKLKDWEEKLKLVNKAMNP